MRPAMLGLALVYGLVELLGRGIIVRTLWKEAMRAGILFDLACVRLLQKVIRPQFEIQGSCDKRGVCCQHIIGDPPRAIKKRPRLLALYAHFHAVAHRFRVVGRGPDEELIFSCGHLRSDGRCGIYRYRPRLCRNYPLLPFFGAPRLLPGCNYKVVPRAVAAMQPRRSLHIVNAIPAIHHPTPPPRPAGVLESPEDYHCIDFQEPVVADHGHLEPVDIVPLVPSVASEPQPQPVGEHPPGR